MHFRIILTWLMVPLTTLHLSAQTPGTPPVRAPFPANLDSAAANEWWTVARKARANNKNPKRMGLTCTGRKFLDLEVPRDEVVAFALYTVHHRTLRMSAQFYPLFPDETRTVRLEVQRDGSWQEIATATVNDIGWSALFEVKDWDDTQTIPYRVRHGARAAFVGSVRKNPVDQSVITVGNLSCNSSRDRGPREGIVRNLLKQDPDVLFFAGDQHYDHREHTAGWLLFGYQFRDLIRNRPTITIPDDHDVGQGNLWGEGGVATTGNGDKGGYIYDPDYVRMVERCQTAHLPAPYDPTPVAQGIGVYYTALDWGGISFAILEDRKFKTGPNGKIPKMGPRPDHIRDPKYNPADVDVPGLVLLGERQLAFLEDWADDWEHAEMKAVLSQTPFVGAAHLHGRGPMRLHADLDSNGWPQTGRNQALRTMRKAFAVHLAGDQHLATALQHGIDEHRDGPYSFVSPAIHNTIYGRYWKPEDEQPGANHDPENPLPWTGDYRDGFNNHLTMLAYANPDTDGENATSGYGIASFDKTARTITVATWGQNRDVSDPSAKPFPGWPITVQQRDNFNPPSWGTLPQHSFGYSRPDPVVQLIDEASGEIVYTLRIKGREFTPHAPKTGTYTLKAGMNAPDQVIATGLKAE